MRDIVGDSSLWQLSDGLVNDNDKADPDQIHEEKARHLVHKALALCRGKRRLHSDVGFLRMGGGGTTSRRAFG